MDPTFAPTEAPLLVGCGAESRDDGGGYFYGWSDVPFLGMSDYFWGITCGLLGSIAINTGNNLQSLGMKELQEAYLKERQGVSYQVSEPESGEGGAVTEAGGGAGAADSSSADATALAAAGPSSPSGARNELEDFELDMTKSKRWILGTCVFLTGSAFNFGSYGLAAQSVLAALEASQFVTNLLFSKFLLGAKMLPRFYAGTVFIVVGTVLIVAFGNDRNDHLSFEDLVDKYFSPIFLAYLVFVVCAAVALRVTHQHYQKMQDAGTPLPNSDIILPVTYAVFSAYFGTLFVVQCKVFMKMCQYAGFAGKNLLLEPLFYTTIVTALPLVAVWLHRLNEALSLYDPLFIIPLIQSNFIIWAIISGGIYFEEFACFDLGMWAGFLGGLSIVLFGLYQLRPEPQESKVAPSDDPDTFTAPAADTKMRTFSGVAAKSGADVLEAGPGGLSPADSQRQEGGAAVEGEERTGRVTLAPLSLSP